MAIEPLQGDLENGKRPEAEESHVVTAGGEVHQSKFAIGPDGVITRAVDTQGNGIGVRSMK